MKPKGLRFFCREINVDTLSVDEHIASPYCIFRASNHSASLDADQLDKLAERCKQWAKYLRSQRKANPVPPKKWEDL